MPYTLSMFNTGQITLPKKWRSQFNTKKFVAQETSKGLLIQPLEVEALPKVLQNKTNKISTNNLKNRLKKKHKRKNS